jgi:hypothetical protein
MVKGHGRTVNGALPVSSFVDGHMGLGFFSMSCKKTLKALAQF